MTTPKLFERCSITYETTGHMLDDVLAYMTSGSEPSDVFEVETCSVLKTRRDRVLHDVLVKQRNAVANNYEPVSVLASNVGDYVYDAKNAFDLVSDPTPLRVFSRRALDSNVRAMLADLCLDARRLDAMGLVLCGGSVLESALRTSPLKREDVSFMGEQTGFDIDLFVCDSVPYMGSLSSYRDALTQELLSSEHVVSCISEVSGFCCTLHVRYVTGESVKMQIVDLGVEASPMSIAASFDVAPSRMFFCSHRNCVVMTEDAALSLANGVIPYDRRFIHDPRYPSRLVKYVRRTGFALVLPDDAAMAAFRIVQETKNRVLAAIDRCSVHRGKDIIRNLGAWMSEMSICDTTVLAIAHVLIDQHGNTNKRGYGSTPRLEGCRPITGGVGRQGLQLLGRRSDPVVELHAAFMLFRIVHNVDVMCD